MDECVIRCLSKIKKAASWRNDKDLRDMIDNICSAIKDEKKRLKKRGVEYKDTDADKYWGCLIQGLENKTPGVKAATMEAITSFIQEGYLHGDAEPLRPLPNKSDYTMMEEIAKYLCDQKDTEDDNMRICLAQALAEVVKMGTVNGEFLLKSIDVCHQIYMEAASGATRDAAEEAVKEIMTFLMQSMDYVDKTKDAETINAEEITPTPNDDEEGDDVVHGFTSDCMYTGVEMQMGFKYDNGAVGWNLETEEEEEEECDEQKLDSLPSQRHRDIYLVFRKLCSIASITTEEGDDDNNKIFALTAIEAAMENIGDDFNKYKAYVYLVRRYLLQNLLQNFISNNMEVVEVSLHIFTPLVNKFRIFIKKEIEVFIVNIFLVILNSQNSAMRHKEMVIEAFNEINKDPNFMIELFINYDCDINSRSMYEDVVRTLANVVEGKYKVVNRRKEENEDGEVEEIVEEEDVYPEEEHIEEELLPAKRIALDALAHILQPLAEKCHITEAENNNTNTNNAQKEEEEELTPGFTPQVQASDTDVKIKAATDILQKFDEKKKYQEDMQTGYAMFNKKPRRGIEFLVKAGRLENTPEAVAQFLYKNSDFLDKREIGDYMGEPKEFNLAVLKAYAEGINFRGMDFDNGIRTFLERFRLPGEAQKIDRMIERFANAYCEQNPGVFVNTDAAFVLGYSVIMLNTDLHNPNIAPENRMTPEGFIRNCRGINDGGDFPPEYLTDIYNRIQQNAISLKEDDMARQQQDKKRYRNKEERRQKAFSVEKMDIMSKLKVDIDDETTEYFEATGNEYIGPMFKIMFPMVVDVYAKVLELSDDEEGIKNTLTAVKDCFEIACSLGLDQERDRSMEILSDNTLVNEVEWLDVKNKQIEMIRVMLELAQNFGNHMGSAWKYILTIVSSLAQVHLYGLEPLARKHLEDDEESGRVSRNGEYVLVEKAREKQQLIESIIDLRSLDRIFAKTANLDSKMIVEFVKALCDVSLTELKAGLNDQPEETSPADESEDDKRPRLYLMQKVVEVADGNMYCRSRLEWTQIWQVMSEYYISLGCFPMGQVALSAIDALKQLSVKFLDKEDLRAYNFQKSFIRPFEYIISRTPSADTREMILHVVHNIVQTRSKQLSSGWKIVFSVCTFCAENEADPLTSIAWSMAKELYDRYFECMVPEMNDLTTTYCAFIGVEEPTISQEAREYVTKCADSIIEGKIVKMQEGQFTDSDDHTKVWWPVFMGLSRYVFKDARYSVRNDCCERIFAIFQNEKVHFNEKLWDLIFTGFIFTIFDGPMKSGVETIDNLLAAPAAEDKTIALGTEAENLKPWLQTSAALTMYSVVRLYVKRRDQIGFMLPKIFELLQQAMHQKILSLGRIGVFCLKQLMEEGADMYDEAMWNTMLAELEKAFVSTMPNDIVLDARKKLYLIYDKNLRAGGVAPKVGRWVRTPAGNGKLLSVDDICATVQLIYGKAYFYKLSELEDLEKLKKEKSKVVKRAAKKKAKEERSSDESSDESSDSEEMVEEVVEEDPIKLETTDNRSLEVDEEFVHTKSVVQEDLAALVSEIMDKLYKRFTFEQVKKMLGLLQQVADMTRDFHQDMELRTMLKTLGFPKEGELLPTLIYEQVAVETSIVHVLFVLYMDTECPDRQEYASNDLLKRMEFLLTEYVEVEKKAHTKKDLEKKENERVAIASIPLMTEILRGIDKTPFEKFTEYCQKFYPLFLSMIQYSGEEVRAGLSVIFSTKIEKMLFH
ncbi:hypothetical protein WA588_000981 [Blastocystis sp. NMH]